MNRRQLLRTSFFGAVGATAVSAREFPPNYDESKELARFGLEAGVLQRPSNHILVRCSEQNVERVLKTLGEFGFGSIGISREDLLPLTA
jgi:hypothetical protein